MNYCKASQSLEPARLDAKMFVSLWNMAGASGEVLAGRVPTVRAIGYSKHVETLRDLTIRCPSVHSSLTRSVLYKVLIIDTHRSARYGVSYKHGPYPIVVIVRLYVILCFIGPCYSSAQYSVVAITARQSYLLYFICIFRIVFNLTEVIHTSSFHWCCP